MALPKFWHRRNHVFVGNVSHSDFVCANTLSAMPADELILDIVNIYEYN